MKKSGWMRRMFYACAVGGLLWAFNPAALGAPVGAPVGTPAGGKSGSGAGHLKIREYPPTVGVPANCGVPLQTTVWIYECLPGGENNPCGAAGRQVATGGAYSDRSYTSIALQESNGLPYRQQPKPFTATGTYYVKIDDRYRYHGVRFNQGNGEITFTQTSENPLNTAIGEEKRFPYPYCAPMY